MDDFEDFLWRLSRHLLTAVAQQPNQMEPYFELSGSDDHMFLTAELPGVRPQDLRVRVCEDEVYVSVVSNGVTVYSGSFSTSRTSPKDARVQFKNGILEVRLPRLKSIF